MDITKRFGNMVAPNGRLVQDNFMRWFKSSQVVDPQGNPLVVYHGTLGNFTRFELGHGEAQVAAFMFVNREQINGYLWPYLDGLKFQQNEQAGDHHFMPVFLSIQNPLRIDTTGTGQWADSENENAWIVEAKAKGHDGLVMVDDEAETVFYVAFEANQIKSAVGNSGLFDAASTSFCDEVTWEAIDMHEKSKLTQKWIEERRISRRLNNAI